MPDESFEYVVSIHALQELPYPDLGPALLELRRVTRRGGWLRLGLPDTDRAIHAYLNGNYAYFHVPDEDALSLGGKLSIQLTWYGASRSLLTWDFAHELLFKAGFGRIRKAAYQSTTSPFTEITALDDRPRETLFVEAVR